MKLYVRKSNGAWWVTSTLYRYHGVKTVKWWRFSTWSDAIREAGRLAEGQHPVQMPMYTYFEERRAA